MLSLAFSSSSPATTSGKSSKDNDVKNPLIFSDYPMEITYDKLAVRLKEKVPSDDSKRQYWVAIAGGPGSGKTTTATEVAKRLNQNVDSDKKVCVVLPMDGFHYSKERLREMDPPDAATYLLRRGAPWTMDAELCYELLKMAKEKRTGELPTYCREISDPVNGGVSLLSHHKVVLVEGLYLLSKDDPRWEPLQELWDEKWLVRCPSREEQRERLIQRSLKTWNDLKVKTWGPGREGAEKKVAANDDLNMDIVAKSDKYADLIIESK